MAASNISCVDCDNGQKVGLDHNRMTHSELHEYLLALFGNNTYLAYPDGFHRIKKNCDFTEVARGETIMDVSM